MRRAGAAMVAAKLHGNFKQKLPMTIAKTAAIHHASSE